MKRRSVILAAAFASPLFAQPAAPPADGRVPTPGPFDAIEIGGAADIRIVQGAADEVAVDGDERDRQRVELSLHDGRLRIDTGGGWQFWNARRLQLTVTLRRLTRLSISGASTVQVPGPVRTDRLSVSISGAGQARFDNLVADELAFASSGAGDAEVAGRVRELTIGISGRSNFRGENLACRRAKVAISGVGDVKVWATEALSITTSGIGRVEYWGSPQVQRRDSGIATVVDRGPKPAPE